MTGDRPGKRAQFAKEGRSGVGTGEDKGSGGQGRVGGSWGMEGKR
jgi:hypothetical protein